MYKIGSFDVGIKNLAFCIICKDDANKMSIEKWDIINIVSDQYHKCGGINKKTKIQCDKNASLFGNSMNSNDVQYFCGSHKSQYTPFTNDLDWENKFIINKDKEIKCTYEIGKTQKMCNKVATSIHRVSSIDSIDNKNYCNQHKKLVIDKIKKNTSLKKIKHTSCTNTNIQELAYNMYTKLNMYPELLSVNEIFIENQPSLKNPTMKTIASLLFGYFVMKNIENKLNMKVKFISASNKLKVDDDKIDGILQKIDNNDKIYKIISDLITKYGDNLIINNENVYSVVKHLINKKNDVNIQNELLLKLFKKIDSLSKSENADEKKNGGKKYDLYKLLSIKYTELLLKDKPTWLTHLNSYPKKDDLCDSLLQGYYFLFF
jgi:hypothetical protein